MILRGELKKFPPGLWERPEADKNAIEITKFLLKEILKWSSNDRPIKLCRNIFIEHNLGGMLQQVYKNSSFEAINAVYPNKFKRWEVTRVPGEYWTLDRGREATKWLLEEKLKWLESDVKEKISFTIFLENNLGGMLTQLFGSSAFNAINATYPNKFKQWEVCKVSRNYWTLQTGIEATKWLIDEKLKWTDAEIKKYSSFDMFTVNGLRAMLQQVYNGSFFAAVDSAYPNKFKPWEISNVTHKYWTLERGIEATKWLIEEKLKWPENDVKKKLSLNEFNEYGLDGMLRMFFNQSPSMALNSAYPDRF